MRRVIRERVADTGIGELAFCEAHGLLPNRFRDILSGAPLSLPMLLAIADALDITATSLACVFATAGGSADSLTTPSAGEKAGLRHARSHPARATGKLGRALHLVRLLRGVDRTCLAHGAELDRDALVRLELGRETSPHIATVHRLASTVTNGAEDGLSVFASLIAVYAGESGNDSPHVVRFLRAIGAATA